MKEFTCPKCKENKLINKDIRIFDAIKYNCPKCGIVWYNLRGNRFTFTETGEQLRPVLE